MTLNIILKESVMLYAAQSWGYNQYETVEKLLRYYVKKCFNLPNATPNYMINIESGLSPLFIKTLKLHTDYILNVLELPDYRLPKIIALKTIERRTLWYKKLEDLALNCGIEFNFENGRLSKDFMNNLILKADEKHREDCINRPTSSLHRSIYNTLNHNLCERNYFSNNNNRETISSIFKMRTELVQLNYIPHRQDLPIYCSLCNLEEREDVIHFIGRCPILKEVRRQFLGITT